MNNNNLETMFLFFLPIIASFVLFLLSFALDGEPILGIFSFILYLAVLVLLYNKRKLLFFILLPFVVGHLWLLLSVSYLEFGAFPPEIQVLTYANGSSSRLVVLLFSFIVGALVVHSNMNSILQRTRQSFLSPYRTKLTEAVVVIFFLMQATLVLNMFHSGVPLFLGEMRFDYWAYVQGAWLMQKILALSAYFFVFIGYFWGKDNNIGLHGTKWMVLCIVGISIAILYSNKFSWIAQALLMLLLGYFAGYYAFTKRFTITYRATAITLFLGLLLFTLVAWNYIYIHGYSGSELGGKIVTRVLELQGQVWWLTDELIRSGKENGEFQQLLQRKSDATPGGIFLLMEVILPSNVYEGYSAKSVPLTAGFEAILIYTVGYFGALFASTMAGGFIAFIGGYLCIKMFASQYYRAIVAVLLYVISAWSISLGSVYILFGKMALAAMTIIILDIFVLGGRTVGGLAEFTVRGGRITKSPL